MELPPCPPDAQSLVGRLRRELRGFGDVNLSAIEAYERLTARYEHLHLQSQDILLGIEEVEKSIRELDQLTRERFLGALEAVRTAFARIFNELFQGGSGSIALY